MQGTIYHYCDINALIHIIQSKKIWLSSSNCLNDPYEIDFFTGKLKDRARRENNTKLVSLLDSRKSFVAFLCCFSRDGDLLSQWRSYGDDGKGVSIAFDPRMMDFDSRKSAEPFNSQRQKNIYLQFQHGLFEVFYDQNFFNDCYDEIQNDLNLLEGKNPDGKTHILIGINEKLDRWSCAFKDSYYSEESEVRLVHIPAIALDGRNAKEPTIISELLNVNNLSNLKFRTSNQFLVPYVEYNLLKYKSNQFFFDIKTKKRITPILGVILGPKSQIDISNIKLLFEKSGLDDDVWCHKSKGKYR